MDTPSHTAAGLDLAALEPIGRRPSAAEFAYEKLREAVISLALPPGTVVSRAAIASRLGVSQTPIREALVRLQEESLIEVVPHSATRVARIDVARAREAGFLRLAVELEIVRRLAETRPAGLAAALHDGLAQMRELLASGDHVAFVAADEAFHFTLYAAAGVPGLHLLVRSRSGHLDRLRRLHLPTPGKADAVLRDHEQIAEAIIRAEPERAERHLRAHLSGTVAELDRIRAEAPEYF